MEERNTIINKMDEPKNTSDHQERKKTAVKVVAPIGSVFLLGGALATAAFVSFIRKRGWSFGKDHRHQNKKPPAESSRQFVVLDKSWNAADGEHHLSNGETELTVNENTAESLTQDVEINGGAIVSEVDDGEAGDQSVVPKVVENGVVSGGSADESFCEKLSSEEPTGNMVPEDATKVPLIKQGDSDESGKEIRDMDQVYTAQDERRTQCDEQKSVKVNEEQDAGEDDGGSSGNRQADISTAEPIVSGGHGEDGQGDVLPVFHAPNVEKESTLATEIMEKVQVDEVMEGSHGDWVGSIDDGLVKKQETCEGSDDVILSEESADICWKGEATVSSWENREENACTDNSTLVSPGLIKDSEFGTEDEAMEGLAESREDKTSKKSALFLTEDDKEKELIFPQSTDQLKEDLVTVEAAEITKVNEDDDKSPVQFAVVDQAEQHKDSKPDEVKDGIETIHESYLSNKDEESSLGLITGDSSVESSELNPVRPAESLQETSKQAKLIAREVEGKTQEDTTIKEAENDDQAQTEEEFSSSNKYIVVKLGKLKGRSLLIGALSVLSSVSCSWYFGLSFVKFCVVLFLTMALSKIHGYIVSPNR